MCYRQEWQGFLVSALIYLIRGWGLIFQGKSVQIDFMFLPLANNKSWGCVCILLTALTYTKLRIFKYCVGRTVQFHMTRIILIWAITEHFHCNILSLLIILTEITLFSLCFTRIYMGLCCKCTNKMDKTLYLVVFCQWTVSKHVRKIFNTIHVCESTFESLQYLHWQHYVLENAQKTSVVLLLFLWLLLLWVVTWLKC